MIGPSTNVGRSLDGVRNKIGSARKKLVESQIVVICWLKSGFKSKRQGNASPMSQAGPGKRATNLDSVRAGEESASQYRGSKSDDERQTADPESQKTPDIDVKPQDPINFDGPAAQELLSDKAFLETLQKCISQDQKLRKTETKVDHRLTLIHEDLASFARRIQFLEDKIVDIEDNGSESEQLKLPALYAKLDERRKEHAKATRERDRLDRKLETSWREQRVDVNRFLSTFEDALITDKLMPPKKTQSFISDLGALSTLSGASESVKSQSRRASEHSFRISLASTADLTPYQLEIRKEKDLLKEYAAACMIIRHDTHAFDSREDYIDNRIAERREKIAAGEEVVPQLEFDLELFQMGRDLTQRFAAAEARWEGAKAALIAAGVPVPGSMVSSGFVDNSGDRLSVDEIDMPVNEARIERWKAGIERCRALEALEPESADVESRQSDHWEAVSVELWESMSMVAVDRQKRRIEKWRQACEQTAIELDDLLGWRRRRASEPRLDVRVGRANSL